MISAKIICDTQNPYNGIRLTTFELVYPRFIHAEVMTHRAFSRNASSSRAIPVAKAVDLALREMVYPVRWGKNQAGMQAKDENLSNDDEHTAIDLWFYAADRCANTAKALADLGVHKQWANRMIEWFSNIRVLVTATEWDNFFELRDHEDAQDEIRLLAQEMRACMDRNIPDNYPMHLPYITPEEFGEPLDNVELMKISAARCCRVSYLKHDGSEPSIEEDLALFERLAGSKPIHASPLEHQAEAIAYAGFSRNFKGWQQFRASWEEGYYE